MQVQLDPLVIFTICSV